MDQLFYFINSLHIRISNSDLIQICLHGLLLTYSVLFVSDNHLQLDAQICLQGKKKSPGKRITGFQVVKLYPLFCSIIRALFSFY